MLLKSINPKLAILSRLKNKVCPIIYLELEGEQMGLYFSQVHYCKMKHKHKHTGCGLRLPIKHYKVKQQN